MDTEAAPGLSEIPPPPLSNLIPGVKPGQERDEKGRLKKKQAQPLETDPAETMLAAMRHVIDNDRDRTVKQRNMREWLKGNTSAFYTRLAALEAEEREAMPKVVAGESSGSPDEGSERVEELIEKLLREAQP